MLTVLMDTIRWDVASCGSNVWLSSPMCHFKIETTGEHQFCLWVKACLLEMARHWCINGSAGEFVMVADPPLHDIAHFSQEVHAEPGFGLGVNCKWCVHA